MNLFKSFSAAVVVATAFAPSSAQTVVQPAQPRALDAPKAADSKDQSGKRGSELRQVLKPHKTNTATNTKDSVNLTDPNGKYRSETTNLIEIAAPEAATERHLTAKEREELRQQLRQQRASKKP